MPISLQQSNAAFSSAFRAPDDQVWHTTLAGIVGQRITHELAVSTLLGDDSN
jgi:hypothetical protein